MKINSISSILIFSLFLSISNGQETKREANRTIDGHPDLQGVWGNNTITPVERPERFGERQHLTDEEQILLQRRVQTL